jgi:hypothetical protein
MDGDSKRKFRELMVDIETMGRSYNASITQIGACYFSMKTGEIGDTYLINLDLDDSIKNGAKVDGSTIYWWLNQSDDARRSLFSEDTPLFKEDAGLCDFNKFWARATRVWSHATFDFVIIMESMKRLGITPTVHYKKARDIRTLTGLSGMLEIEKKNYIREGVHHNGLDDAIYQVKYCSEVYKALSK